MPFLFSLSQKILLILQSQLKRSLHGNEAFLPLLPQTGVYFGGLRNSIHYTRVTALHLHESVSRCAANSAVT